MKILALWLLVGSALAVAVVGCGGSSPKQGAKSTSRPSPGVTAPPPAGVTGTASVGVDFSCLAAPRTAPTVYGELEGHVTWVRLVLDWSVVQPTPRSYSRRALAVFRDCVAEANDSGINVLVTFLGTPAWARNGGTELAPPAKPQTYAQALAYLARRFKNVAAWEVWNEENTQAFWTGTPVQYVQLLQAAYPAVKHANPSALVLFGGTAHDDAAWLRACYQDGVRGSFDVMATHPYPRIRANLNVPQVLSGVAAVRQVMHDYADEKQPVWFTEFGWSRSAVSEQQQATALTQSFAYIRAHLPYVTNAFWFEATGAGRGWLGGLSLLPHLQTTPAYEALRRLS